MVGQILAFSLQYSGSRMAAKLNSLLLELFQIMQKGLPKSISLKFRDDALTTHLLVDSNQLSEVFINASTNAYEAVDEHTGEISVSAEAAQLSVKTKFLQGELTQRRYVLVKISDNGIGLKKEKIEKLFDPFYTSKEMGD
jgi:two-component system cell cycle sensor histidine kinase/response regulator CckA